MIEIEIEVSDRIAWLRPNWPHALNALNRELTSAIEAALDEVTARGDVSVLVMRSR